jgi:hypothetical protein
VQGGVPGEGAEERDQVEKTLIPQTFGPETLQLETIGHFRETPTLSS